MQNEKVALGFMLRLSERLAEKGFSNRILEDGTLSVKGLKGSGKRGELCIVGKEGEVYCSSKDLAVPNMKTQVESVLETVNELQAEMEGADVPAQNSVGGMTLG